jgi:indolepyruvate decarboxylase
VEALDGLIAVYKDRKVRVRISGNAATIAIKGPRTGLARAEFEYAIAREIMELAEKMQLPVAVINTAKAVVDETFPHYLGIYNGKASEPHVREAIETSDGLLSIGYRPIEVTTGDFTASLPANTIRARGHSVDVGDDNYQAVTLKEVLRGIIDAVPHVRNRAPRGGELARRRLRQADSGCLLAGYPRLPPAWRRPVRR